MVAVQAEELHLLLIGCLLMVTIVMPVTANRMQFALADRLSTWYVVIEIRSGRNKVVIHFLCARVAGANLNTTGVNAFVLDQIHLGIFSALSGHVSAHALTRS